MLGIIGSSKEIKQVIEDIRTVLEYNLPVFIFGETGTGKELVAQAIHYDSSRKNEKFCAINSSCVSEDLIESQLFGHVRGAFTGAIHNHEGLFQFANNGTIFLDEISNMSPLMQIKLLRVLESKTFQMVGSNINMKTNARIVSASNVDLQEKISENIFREDLYHRLQVFPITMFPLRERKGDIPELCKHFLGKFCSSIGCEEIEVGKEVMDLLVNYHWPGNIRELKNFLERAVLLANRNGGHILPEHFNFIDENKIFEAKFVHKIIDVFKKKEVIPIRKVESMYIKEVLDLHNWNLSKVADLLEINIGKIYRIVDVKKRNVKKN